MDENLSSKRYEPVTINLDNKNSAHSYIIENTGFNKTVLEIGTSTGYISKILKEQGNRIIGIEIDEEAGSLAQQYCDQMIVGDVETLDLDELLIYASIDVIVCGDVLEHLKKPATTLKKLRKFLKPEGYLIVSLPNFFHGDVLLNLLNGDFHYTPTGLLDESHLHFFGLKNIYSVFADCGYQIKDLHTITLSIGTTELKIDKIKIPHDLLKFIQSLPDSTVYQYVFRAYPSSDTVSPPDIREPDIPRLFSDSLQESRQELQAPLEAKIADLTASRNALTESLSLKENQVQDLTASRNALTESLSLKENQVQDLTAQLNDREQKLLSLEQSIIWQFTMKFHSKIVEKLLPQNTRRRKYYDLGRAGGKILVNEGWDSFWWKYHEKRSHKIRQWKKIVVLPAVDAVPDPQCEDIKMFDICVSIIIPTKNAGNDFEYTLEKIKNQKGIKKIEIIVIDSGSTDDTLTLAERFEADISIISPTEFGHGKTRNLGAEKASGDFLIFMVQDAIPIGDLWLYSMVNFLNNHPSVVAATCKQVPRSDAGLFSCNNLFNHYWVLEWTTDYIASKPKNFDKLSQIEKRKLCGLDNVCSIIKKPVFEQFKFRDVGYGEDLDLGVRLIKSGMDLAFLQTARVIHSHNRGVLYYLKRSYIDTITINQFLGTTTDQEKIDFSEFFTVAEFFCIQLSSLIEEFLKEHDMTLKTTYFVELNCIKNGLLISANRDNWIPTQFEINEPDFKRFFESEIGILIQQNVNSKIYRDLINSYTAELGRMQRFSQNYRPSGQELEVTLYIILASIIAQFVAQYVDIKTEEEQKFVRKFFTGGI